MLYTKSWIDHHMEEITPWQQTAFTQFSALMCDEENPFPCVPGKQGFQTDTLRFGFAEDPRKDEASEKLVYLLKQYGGISRDTGNYASLVVFFNSGEIPGYDHSVESYQQIFWDLLNRVHKSDDTPWPDDIAKDPHDHTWEFCFNGEPYFAFCATPAHIVRKSRHFPYFLLAFQPRWVFDEINFSTAFGQKLKKVIRKRLVDYDEVEPHPSLKWYGQEDNYEWKQYYLSDDDSSMSKCPFSHIHKKIKS
jgi:uncharacterized protein